MGVERRKESEAESDSKKKGVGIRRAFRPTSTLKVCTVCTICIVDTFPPPQFPHLRELYSQSPEHPSHDDIIISPWYVHPLVRDHTQALADIDTG